MSRNDPPLRCADLWQRLIGLFGADAMRRKFGDKPPPEWISMIARLSDFELQRGMRRLVYSGKAHVPSLPEFVKLCRNIGAGDDVEDGPRAPILPVSEDWKGDEWDDRANRRFMGYLFRTGKAAAKVYGEGRYLGHTLGVSVHPSRAARNRFLLIGKQAWSHEMRHCTLGERTQQYADLLWAELMEAAEKQAAKEILGSEAFALKDAA